MTLYATHSDVAHRWPSLPSTQYDQADTFCEDASLVLTSQYPGLDSQVQLDPDLAQRVKVVVCNMVKRAIMTPTPGASQESASTGPYAHSVTYSNPDGNLFVTKAEDLLIRGYQRGAVSVSASPDVVC